MTDILIILALILLNGIFSMAEIAVLSARRSRLGADARRGSRAAACALRLARDPDRFLSTIQIGITLIGILTGLYSGAALGADAGELLQRCGLSSTVARNVGQACVVAVVTYLSIVAGELVPKRIGLAAADTVAKLIARPMYVLSIVALPAVWLLSVSTAFLVKVLGIRQSARGVTEEEIRALIHDGAEAGEVRKVEQDIMERALVLGDLRVAAIMTPKVDVATLHLDMGGAELRERLAAELHNAYPVYCDSTRRTVCGIVTLKQLILAMERPDFELAAVVAEAVYFPETMSVYDALDRMKTAKIHFALVCDEFGDMTGVLTPSDILEGLVGALPQRAAEPDIRRGASPGVWVADAAVPFYDFLCFFGLEDCYRPAAYATLGGFVLELLRHVPQPGECFKWNKLAFEVASVDGAKIGKLIVREMQPEGRDVNA